MTAAVKPASKSQRRNRVIIVLVIVGALAFSLYLGIEAYENQSFPVQTEPFALYATVTEARFNGTIYLFVLNWSNGNYTPLFAQMTADQDQANSPVCSIGDSSVSTGQTLTLPFSTNGPITSVSNVDLYIAVKNNTSMNEFTIDYHINNATAQIGDLAGINYSCVEAGEGGF